MLSEDSLIDPFKGLTGRLVVALSGGLDSCVLLDLVARLARERHAETALHVLHVNHGLSPLADSWEAHCRGLAAHLDLPFTAVRIELGNSGSGLEERARRARYEVFSDFLEPGDRLLLAHHLDDQAETILFRLVRGSGPLGLRGMPVSRRLGVGTLLRPLLRCSRASIRRHAEECGLEWMEDESNLDPGPSRNYLRHQVLPVLRARWPDVAARIRDGASAASDLLTLAQELAELDLDRLCGDGRTRIDLAALAALPQVRQLNALRGWIDGAAIAQPTTAQLLELLGQVANGVAGSAAGGSARIVWRDGEIRRFRRHLYLMRPLPAREPLDGVVLSEGCAIAAGGGVLEAERTEGRGLRLEGGLDSLRLGYRQGGERCRPEGRAGSHPLRKLFQELGVPPWLRDRVPLLYVGDELVGAAGLFTCYGHVATAGQTGWQFEWKTEASHRIID